MELKIDRDTLDCDEQRTKEWNSHISPITLESLMMHSDPNLEQWVIVLSNVTTKMFMMND